MQEFFDQTWLGNTVQMYITAAGIFILAILIIYILKAVFLSRFKKWAAATETTVDDFILRGVEKAVIPLLYFGGFYLAVQTLNLGSKVNKAFDIASAVLVVYLSIRLIISIINFSLSSYLARKGESDSKQRQVRGVLTLVKIVIWAIGLVFLLDNLGFDISAVVAGLGIGGIAIALAAQTILGDIFSYFVIFFDRPFAIGDYIIVGDKMGTVEYLGIKTTRIRSLGGEQVILSNTDLVNSRVHNYKRMEKRRIVFSLGVTYDTKAETLKEIPGLIKKIIEEIPDTTFDRAHFVRYGDFSLNFEIVYYVLSQDYIKYMDIQQNINLSIYTEFEKRQIQFAYPTQTLFVNKEEPK